MNVCLWRCRVCHGIPELGYTRNGHNGKLMGLSNMSQQGVGMEAITAVTFQLMTDEVAYLEACLARRRELLALADSATHGKVFAACENATVEISRQYAQGLLTDAITRRVSQAEKKGRRPASAPAA
jgi:hypothetical protein